MKKLKLSDLQRHKVREAHRFAFDVLREVKSNQLEGAALKDMKTLEGAVQHIEAFLLGK